MSLSSERLERARTRSDAARNRLAATAAELKARLSPRRLASDAVGEARSAGDRLVATGTETARRYPAAVSGVVGVAALLFVVRGIRRLSRRRRRRHETDDPAESLKTKRARPRRWRRSV